MNNKIKDRVIRNGTALFYVDYSHKFVDVFNIGFKL